MKPSTHRPTRAIISLTAIQDNIKQFKTHVGKQTEVWAVVKANAYGHGAISVSQSIDDLVAGFCVSNLDEAIELRSQDRKSTRLNSSHHSISYAEFCLKKKKL